MNPVEFLKSARTILVIDWPSKEVPESLARAGFQVIVKGGPGPEDYSAYELSDGKIVSRRTGRAPDHVDLVYSYRPLNELPDVIASACSLRAKAIWLQSGLSAAGVKDRKGCWLGESDRAEARTLVEGAGLSLITEPYIAEVASELQLAH